jgi:LCP family protein required for cell wall assembly
LSLANLEPVKDITNDPFVFYLSGSDTRSALLTRSNSDVNILVVVNPKTKQVLLLNTPRDYYIPNPAGNGALDKLTHCGVYGTSCSVQALSDLYHVTINYCAQINFSGFEKLIDAIGGVTVDSDYAFTTRHGHYSISKGPNHLNGSEALGFVRERYSFGSGDNQRGRNQMKVLTAVIKKLSAGTVVMHYGQILDSLQGMFTTSISGDQIAELVKMQLDDGADWNVKSYAVTGNGGSEITYSIPRMRVYVMFQDKELVDRGINLIDRVINGEILTDADVAKQS